jgi:hypothetical protein
MINVFWRKTNGIDLEVREQSCQLRAFFPLKRNDGDFVSFGELGEF